ncbi:MAG: SDR family oxidoreductase [Pseudomonadota bacterium]
MMSVVVVTGGTRGLGIAIVQRLSQEGYSVIATGREKSSELSALIDSNSDRVHFEAFDFNDTSEIRQFARSISTNYGRIYGLVNNAAIGRDGILATMHERQISELIRVNIEAPALLTKYLLRPMLLNGRGRVINISSIIATTGYTGLSVYGATKAAIEGFTKSLAREVGRAGITVNTISPGFMQTEMTHSLNTSALEKIKRRSPLGRLVDVEDVAESVAFLMGPAADGITGSTLTVDAGSTA